MFQDVYRPVFMSVISKLFTGQARGNFYFFYILLALVFSFYVIVISLANNFGNTLSTYIYIQTVEYFPGFVFMFFCTFAVLATIFGTYFYIKILYIYYRIGVYLSLKSFDQLNKYNRLIDEEI